MRIWIDCTAAAHPLVFRPLIEHFEARGCEVLVTSREYGQTLGILDRLGIPYVAVGRHGGSTSFGKVGALASRSSLLARVVWRWRPNLALAHGSVDLALVSAALRVPSVQIQDYEFAGWQRKIAFRQARRVLAPEAIPVERLADIGAGPRKLIRYPGLKEDYYLADMQPDDSVLAKLGLSRDRVLVVMRPPPETSEYHAPNAVFDATLRRLAGVEGVQTVVIPRTDAQRERALTLSAGSAAGDSSSGPAVGAETTGSAPGGRVVVPDHAIDAQSLIAFADLVVSAGGTMNREAVALGTPVYTTFAGRMGGVDEALIAEGRLRVLNDPADLDLTKRTFPAGPLNPRDPAFLADAALSALPRTTS